jgi:hypothetical protein
MPHFPSNKFLKYPETRSFFISYKFYIKELTPSFLDFALSYRISHQTSPLPSPPPKHRSGRTEASSKDIGEEEVCLANWEAQVRVSLIGTGGEQVQKHLLAPMFTYAQELGLICHSPQLNPPPLHFGLKQAPSWGGQFSS